MKPVYFLQQTKCWSLGRSTHGGFTGKFMLGTRSWSAWNWSHSWFRRYSKPMSWSSSHEYYYRG